MSNAALHARSGAIVNTQEELGITEGGASVVSWGAIIAGAVVASALSLALLMLGAGIGLVSVSPWSNNNVSVTTFGILAAAWFIAVQLFASGVGGYLAGRLRTRWVSVHTDEVYFRDTAHGLIVWGVGAIVTAWLLTSGAASVVSGAAHAGGSALEAAGTAVGGPAAQAAGQAASSEGSSAAYFTDMLFRTDHPDTSGDAGAARAEVGRILVTDALSGEMPAADKAYVAQVVAARTGLSQADADKRVSEVVEQAKNAKEKAIDTAKAAADAARKTGVYVALWAFISLLIGAFSASFMATVGGRVRDDLPMAG
ncbi:MAG: hypothetical protein WB715_20575 [Roseiarcus sp.]|uniref:hypothetical protein n=1 Tax=Roseiarcus sp. TaxID=1969460 RepID=UPI003C3C1522